MTEPEQLTVGKRLQKRRLELGLSVADIAQKTRIQADLLNALEEDRFEALPGETYLYGFVRSYAESLALAPDAVVAQLRAQLGTGEVKPEPPAEETVAVSGDPQSRGRNATILVLVALAGLIVLAAVFMGGGTDEPEPVNVVVLAEQEDGPSTAGEGAEMSSEKVTKVSRLSVIPKEGALFRIKTSEAVSIQVEVDGRAKQDYDLPPGAALSWRVETSLGLHTTKPAALQVWLDGEAIDMADAATLELGPFEPAAIE